MGPHAGGKSEDLGDQCRADRYLGCQTESDYEQR